MVSKLLTLLILFVGITAFSSCKKDKTLDIDITEYEWELKSVSINSNTSKTPKGNFHLSNAYILSFQNDTLFWLGFSINNGGGNYEIPSKGEISIISYRNLSRAAMTDFDKKLMFVFNEMTSYTVKGKTLTFKGNSNEVEFRKK